jgi:Fe2+ or Zn2+ uptake regulation protein
MPRERAAAILSEEVDDLVAILHARHQRVTPQRLIALRHLRRIGHHVTADEIRSAIRDELPGVSTPTVYATLELLVELGMARRLTVAMGATLYDPRIEPHGHTVCRRCGAIDDLDMEIDLAPASRAAVGEGFHPQAVELVVSGLCARCAGGD